MRFFPIIPDIAIIVILVAMLATAVFCGFNKNYRRIGNFRRIAIAILVLFVLMRPTVINVEAERYINKLNVYFIIDNSGSMVTKDMDNGKKYRYEVVYEDVAKFVDLFAGAKFSAFVCDYDSYQATPLSGSTSSILSFANNSHPKNNILNSWTNISNLLETASDKIEVYNKKNPDRASIVFIMSDGEESGDNEGTISAVPTNLAKNIVGGAVIGYGKTDNNKKVTKVVFDEPAEDQYVDHVSKLDEDNLRFIAEKLSLNYYERESFDELFDDSTRFLSQYSQYEQEGDINSRFELYWLFALLIVGLLIWDFSDILNELFSERKAK
ncbi:VWA domain-containing protein [Candidatus Saccharibacteria bacterium]|nr:VWA domain-containing protein [Candidatus Saccharibacteria bacterium]